MSSAGRSFRSAERDWLEGTADVDPDGTVNEASKAAALEPMAKFAPLRRVGETNDVAYGVLYLASDASSFVTGQLLSPNGGVSMSY